MSSPQLLVAPVLQQKKQQKIVQLPAASGLQQKKQQQKMLQLLAAASVATPVAPGSKQQPIEIFGTVIYGVMYVAAVIIIFLFYSDQKVSIKVKTITSSSITFEDTTNNTSSQISPSTTTTLWKVDNRYEIYRNRLTKKYSIEVGSLLNQFPLILKIPVILLGVGAASFLIFCLFALLLFCLSLLFKRH